MPAITEVLAQHPVLWKYGSFTLTAHGLAFAIAAEAGYLALAFLARRKGLPAENLAEKVLGIFFFGLLAARIGFFVIYPSQFRSLAQVLSIWQGGLVSFFGMAGGLAAAWFLFKHRRGEWLGLLSVAALLAWGIGRLGNYWEGDSVGVLSAHWAVFYGRVPIQLFESVLCLALYVFWSRRTEARNLLAWVLVSYLGVRFLVDFWRDEGMWAGLHASQWVSLALMVPLITYLWRHAKR